MNGRRIGVAVLVLLSVWGPLWGAQKHRVLVLDIGRGPSGRAGCERQRLLVIDIESETVLAQTEIGSRTNLALTPDRRLVSVLSCAPDALPGATTRASLFRASDLARQQRGLLHSDIPRLMYQNGAGLDGSLSPDGRQLLIQGVHWFGAGAAHMQTTSLNCVTPELDAKGRWKRCGKTVRVPRSYGVSFIRVADWPRIVVWNANVGLLETVDLAWGQIMNRLYLCDYALPSNTTPADLDKAETPLIFAIRGEGSVISDGGRYAYYIPTRPTRPNYITPVLKKIDLSVDPPKVVRQSPRDGDGLRAGVVCGDRLYVVKDERDKPRPNNGVPLPSWSIKVFRISDLSQQREIQASVNAIDELEASRDGKYLYALDCEAGHLDVIDTRTRREVSMLKNVGVYPLFMIALPDDAPGHR
jgi:hypothetical protein